MENKTNAENEMTDKKLDRLIGEGKLESLDPIEIAVLKEYYSNSDLKSMRSLEVKTIQKRLRKNVKSIERQRLVSVPEDELEKLMDYYKQISDEVEEVVCQNCSTLIALEIKHKQYDSNEYFKSEHRHWNGRFIIAVGNNLFGFRKRLDNVMGYRCGGSLENPEYTKLLKAYRKLKRQQENRESDWDIEQIKFSKVAEKWGLKYGAKTIIKEDGTLEDIPEDPKAPPKPKFKGGNRPIPFKPPVEAKIIPCDYENTMSKVEMDNISKDHLKKSIITNDDIIKVKKAISEKGIEKPVKKVTEGFSIDNKFTLRKVK